MKEPKHSSLSSLGVLSGFIFGAAVLALAWGCSAGLPKIPTYAEADTQAKKELVAHVPAETQLALDGGLAGVQPERALAKDTPAPSSGVFMTPNRYAIYKTIKVDRELLIRKYGAEALAARTKAIILDATTKSLKEAAQRNWFEKNSLWIGIVTGFVLGTALTVGLVYGLTGGEGIK